MNRMSIINHLFIFASILLTTYMQLILKWQSRSFSILPEDFQSIVGLLVRFLFNPWIISAFFAAFFSMLAWTLAVRQLPLSYAYPFVGITFVLVTLGGVYFFQEAMTTPKLIGIICITVGIVLIGRG